MDDELLPWLRAQIADAREQADSRHTLACNLVLGSISGNHNDPCDCGWPAAVLAQCEAHTALLDLAHLVLGADQRNDLLRYQMLRGIALAYRHNPGYREEWRP